MLTKLITRMSQTVEFAVDLYIDYQVLRLVVSVVVAIGNLIVSD
jgi:hypothetical protein